MVVCEDPADCSIKAISESEFNSGDYIFISSKEQCQYTLSDGTTICTDDSKGEIYKVFSHIFLPHEI